MNTLLTQIQFGLKRFKNFRKRLVLDYKWGNKHAHKNTHAIPLELKQELLKVHPSHLVQEGRRLEKNQRARKAKFNSVWKVRKTWYFLIYSGFVFQKDKLPTYNIPNIDGFELLPYVEYMAPKLTGDLLKHQQQVNQKKIQELSQPKEVPKLEVQAPSTK